MRFVLVSFVAFAFVVPAFAQKKVTVRPDGTVTVEESKKRTATCQCGPDCPCSPCKCAPVKAKAPPPPAVILPAVVYGEPVYLPPVRYAPMPVRAVPVVPLYAEPPRRKFTLFGLDLGPVKVKLGEAK